MLIWILGLLSVILMIAMGLPIAFSMLTIGFFGLVILIGFSPSLAMIGQIFFDNGMNYTLSILPLFLLMGKQWQQYLHAEVLVPSAVLPLPQQQLWQK